MQPIHQTAESEHIALLQLFLIPCPVGVVDDGFILLGRIVYMIISRRGSSKMDCLNQRKYFCPCLKRSPIIKLFDEIIIWCDFFTLIDVFPWAMLIRNPIVSKFDLECEEKHLDIKHSWVWWTHGRCCTFHEDKVRLYECNLRCSTCRAGSECGDAWITEDYSDNKRMWRTNGP